MKHWKPLKIIPIVETIIMNVQYVICAFPELRREKPRNKVNKVNRVCPRPFQFRFRFNQQKQINRIKSIENTFYLRIRNAIQ